MSIKIIIRFGGSKGKIKLFFSLRVISFYAEISPQYSRFFQGQQ